MSEKCFTPDDFDYLLELPDGHEDLRHLDTCPECRSELDLYRSFLSRDNVPDGANLADANARLDNFLEREIGGTSPTILRGPTHSGKPRFDLRRWSPVLVAACLAGVALFVGFRDDGRMDYPSGVVRDMSTTTPALDISETATADGFVLTWTGPADADGYQVVVLNTSMVEIDRFTVDLSGEYRLGPDRYQWLQDSGPYFWYMVGLRDGDEIARSAVHALESSH